MAARARKKESREKTVTRKIFFYRVNAGVHPDTGTPREIDFHKAIEHLDAMSFSTEGRYLDSEDDKQLCCWTDNLKAPFRIRMANIRRGQYPPVENAGEFSPLVLGAGKGLAEITHLILFPDGFCGAEFNFYGPRASQLSYYFALKLQGFCLGFRLASIIRPDLDARLAALNDIKLLDLKVRASFASTLAEADADLGAAFNANIKAVNGRPEDELELRFVRKKNKKLIDKAVPEALIGAVRWLAQKPNLKDQVSIFKVSGKGEGDSRLVDILHEQFTAAKSVQPALDQSGGVESSSMYAAIEEAYIEMKGMLATAKEIEYE
jgi:hypothetical protein